MNLVLLLILALSLTAGQLVRVPIFASANINLLDLSVVCIDIFTLIKIKNRLKPPPLFIKLSLLFLLIGLISLFITPLNLSLNEKINSFLYTIRLSSIFIFGWLISQKTLTTKQIEFILITAGALTATLGLFQFLFLPDLSFLAQFGWDPHYYRLASTFLDPNFMGSFLSLILLLIFFSLEKNILKYKKILFLLVYLALLLTFSRSAYLMFSLCFLTASFLQKSLKIFLITLILISGLFLGFKIYQNLVAQPHNVDRTASAQTRLSSWQQGFMIFTHSPLLGVGFNSYHYALREYNLASESQITGHGGSSNDSSLLFVLDTTGLIGLTVYLIFLGVIFKIGLKAWQNRLLLGTILIAFLLGLIIQSFFIDTLFYSFLLLPLILILASLESNFEKTK